MGRVRLTVRLGAIGKSPDTAIFCHQVPTDDAEDLEICQNCSSAFFPAKERALAGNLDLLPFKWSVDHLSKVKPFSKKTFFLVPPENTERSWRCSAERVVASSRSFHQL